MRATLRLLSALLLLVLPLTASAQDSTNYCAMNHGSCPGQWVPGVGAAGCECRCPDGRMASGHPKSCSTEVVAPQQPVAPLPPSPPPAPPAQTTGGIYGAIAYSPSTQKIGFSWRYPTQAEAEQTARQFCEADDCKIATWFGDNCGALATGPQGWGGDYGPDVATARAKAIQRCSQYSSNCRVVRWVCSKRCSGSACDERNTTGE